MLHDSEDITSPTCRWRDAVPDRGPRRFRSGSWHNHAESGDPKAGLRTKHIGINKHAVTDPIVQAVHVKAGSHKLWSASNVEVFNRILADRARHGLDRVVFFPAPPAGATRAVEDTGRTEAALDYAAALSRGEDDALCSYGFVLWTTPPQIIDVSCSGAQPARTTSSRIDRS